MDKTIEEKPQKSLPINNLFLNSGLVNGTNHWSIYLLTISFTMFCYVMAPLVTFLHLIYLANQNGMSYEAIFRNVNVLQDPVATGIDLNFILIALFGIFVFTMLGLWIGIRKFHQKLFLSVVTAYEKFRFSHFWLAFLVWSLMVILTVALGYMGSPDDFKVVFNLQGFIVSCILLIILMPIQTGWEEVFFRGYLMQGLALIFKNGWLPLIITSLLFGLAHMTNPEVDKYGWQIMLPYYTGFGLFLGALTLMDEGLELAFGVHLANNLISSILITSNDSVLKTYSVFETKIQDPSSDILLTLAMVILAFGIFWFTYRWKNFSLILK